MNTEERLLKSNVTKEESMKIERILRQNNISYFEKWNFHRGIFKSFDSSKHAKCDIYVHKDSFEKAQNLTESVAV